MQEPRCAICIDVQYPDTIGVSNRIWKIGSSSQVSCPDSRQCKKRIKILPISSFRGPKAMTRKQPGSSKVVTGWKNIAAYLDKGVRTVQRYERELGLPIRRPAGKPRAAVIATKAELDAWVAASPYRTVFALQKPSQESTAFAWNLENSVAEMRRLRQQMTQLRNELSASMAELKGSVQNVKRDMLNSLYSVTLLPLDELPPPATRNRSDLGQSGPQFRKAS
jgi:hypothetical protein